MKSRKNIIILLTVVILLIVGTIVGYSVYAKSSGLTISEKNFLDDAQRSNKLISLNVINNADVFGNNGTGVFYDFLKDFTNKYSLNLNEVTFNYGVASSGVTLGAKTKIDDSDIVIYNDHYVLVSQNKEVINGLNKLNGKTIGILSNDLSYVSNYFSSNSITYKSYEKIDDLYKGLEEDNYAILPLHLYLEDILTKKYQILYHFSDINMYYVLSPEKDNIFSDILVKYYKTYKSNIINSYNENLFTLMTKSLTISETEIDAMQSMNYEYGFINNSPYEIISNGKYGGIVAVYLKNFMDFANTEFNFTRYSSYTKFSKALAKDNVDIYFGYYNIDNNFTSTIDGISSSLVVVANTKNDIVVNSIKSLINKKVYVDKNSYLYTYLKKFDGIDIKTYTTTKDLLKLKNKNEIIVVDTNIFEYYKAHGLENYTVRYSETLDYVYGFRVKKNNALYKLLNSYMSITDSHRVLNEGFYNHEKVAKIGIILGYVAKYIIYLLAILLVIIFFVIRKTRKITIAKKIKKDDKVKFIDQLTLLKNRNYLNENISKWNNNTIYPQAVLVVDLNKLQSINDIEGYEEGDKQIKAAANALIKTQLNNSDIIRTDGNEFVIYMVGYSQKQITNYIHKLNKEFNKLPYNYGAEFGYSMILDDIKTIEDALNEATKVLKKQKESNENKDKE